MSEFFAYLDVYSSKQKLSLTPYNLSHPSHLFCRGSLDFCRQELSLAGYKPIRNGSMVYKGDNGVTFIISAVE
jgi:hypothetical protein